MSMEQLSIFNSNPVRTGDTISYKGKKGQVVGKESNKNLIVIVDGKQLKLNEQEVEVVEY